ncbi:DMT family transporter [Clostridiaceae bacterium HSG29]|nr:DMT family transporter [Clostridiaceae bacterium HSG29]
MKENLFKNKVSSGIMALICTILWGSAFPVLKVSFRELNILPVNIYSKLYFAGIRFLIAALALFIVTKFILKINFKIEFKYFKQLLLLGFFQTTLMYFFFYNGLGFTTGIKSSIIMSSSNFFVIIIAHFIYKNDKINHQKIIGLTTGFLGIILINFDKLPFDMTFTFRGEGFLILGALAGTFGTFLGKNLTLKVHPMVVTTYQMFLGSLILLILGKIGMGETTLKFNTLSFTLLIYASFISSAAFAIWFTLLKYHKAGEITLYRFLIPVSGSILSVIFLAEEHFTINILIALFLVSTGIILINTSKIKKQM